MKNVLTVMRYTFREAMCKKSFLISNVVLALIIVLLFNLPNLVAAFSNPNGGEEKARVLFISEQSLIPAEAFATYPGGGVAGPEELEACRGQVSEGELDALVVVREQGVGLTYDYYWNGNDRSETVTEFLNGLQTQALLERAGVDGETAQAIQSGVAVSSASDLTPEGKGGLMGLKSILPMVASYILFFIIYFYGYQVSTSISSEKTSRVMETLVTSTSPTAIVLGKTFASGLLGLLQLVFLILVCAVSYIAFLPEEFQILGLLLGSGGTSAGAVLMILAYFVMGYLVYAMLNAVTGATVSKVEDIASANMPVTVVTMIAFFASYFTSMAPGSPANMVVSLIPFTSPFTMPGRILAGGVPGWQIALSIVLLLGTAAFIAYLSIRIYSALILHYGNRLKPKDLFLAYRNH